MVDGRRATAFNVRNGVAVERRWTGNLNLNQSSPHLEITSHKL